MVVGWSEWCGLPELGLSAIKVKVDSGATTSALHAFNIKLFKKGEERFARFDIHPIQKNDKISKTCVARLVDKRHVKSSSGDREKRPVILTPVTIAGQTWEIQVTLTNRDTMGFRMLLGREAMNGRILIDPSSLYLHKKLSRKQARKLYREE